jgi:hypothetical protein
MRLLYDVPISKSNLFFFNFRPASSSVHHSFLPGYTCMRFHIFSANPAEIFRIAYICDSYEKLFSVTKLGCAIAQTVSSRLPTEAARVQSQIRSCGVCDGQSGTGAGFLRVLRIPLSVFIPPTAPTLIIIYHPGLI